MRTGRLRAVTATVAAAVAAGLLTGCVAARPAAEPSRSTATPCSFEGAGGPIELGLEAPPPGWASPDPYRGEDASVCTWSRRTASDASGQLVSIFFSGTGDPKAISNERQYQRLLPYVADGGDDAVNHLALEPRPDLFGQGGSVLVYFVFSDGTPSIIVRGQSADLVMGLEHHLETNARTRDEEVASVVAEFDEFARLVTVEH